VTAFYGKPKDITLRLFNVGAYGAVPVEGVPFDEVTLNIRKNGEHSFTERPLLAEEWFDIGFGFYALRFSGLDLSVLGELRYVLSGPAFDQASGAFDVDPAPISYETTPPQCIVSGNIVDIGGNPLQQTRVYFQPKNVPGKTEGSIIAAGNIDLLTDVYGNFTVKLIRESRALVTIPDAGIRVLINVPDASSANLIDLLPPIPPVP
jgi:hypothetical protein